MCFEKRKKVYQKEKKGKTNLLSEPTLRQAENQMPDLLIIDPLLHSNYA